MTAFNIVRFRVKPGREEDFIASHQNLRSVFPGLIRAHLVKTGEGTYCFVGEWSEFTDIIGAREQMIGLLDTFRDMLEEIGPTGVTDPVSGKAVLQIWPQAAAEKARAPQRKAVKKKPVAKKTGKKPAKKVARKPMKRKKKNR